MLKKVLKFLKNKQRVLDTANVLLGLLMLTALAVFWKTGNKISMYLVIFSGGLMNLSNGYRYLNSKDHKNMGYSMILLGVVILVLGLVVMVL
ncbi:MAG: hypothetical protein J6J42_02425 [Lachnospiraceae bacterium]|nr:hypothetical protein [Lachnospiraceae bacterium]MBP3609174.1 hypothetical protein [Lachnospiraceae bacterium]